MRKRLIWVSVTFLVLSGIFQVSFAMQEGVAQEGSSIWINPTYRGHITENDLSPKMRTPRSSTTETCYSQNDIVALLNQKFLNRVEQFSFKMVYNFTSGEVENLLEQAREAATEGDDYLEFSIFGISTGWTGGNGNVTVNYSAEYLANYSQEQQVNQRVSEILASITSPGMNDEEKEKAIHDWIVQNVEYDNSLVEHSAYAALFKGYTVCQGYSLLTYKMLEEVGIDARIIDSDPMNHAWNMVNLCGDWYHLDVTWNDPDNGDQVHYTYYNLSDTEISAGYNPHYSWRSDAPDAPVSYVEGACGGASALEWQTSKSAAMSLASSQGKLVLLMAGRPTCGNCQYMKDTVCEITNPGIRQLIDEKYVPWFSDVDTGGEHYTYTTGLGSYTLPMICVIDPANPDVYEVRTTGVQNTADFYAMLSEYADSETVELKDAIIALKICSGVTVAQDDVPALDVNGDGRVGLPEAIYVLRKLAGF